MRTPQDPEYIVRTFFREFFGSEEVSSAYQERSLLAAVSGGADSVFLLVVLHLLAPEFGYSLSAVTVNHRMRSETESAGDANFVQNVCAALNPPVPCYRIDLPEGAVSEMAKVRGRGEEDAARVLRYREFETVARERGIRWICTGHTQNDQLETLLMRTIQGAPIAAKRGIQAVTQTVIRPLLTVEREALESWLVARGYTWREDHTNHEDRFFRNRIRSRLVPVLDESFPGWRRGLLAGARKAAVDEQFISTFQLPEWKRESTGLSCRASDYFALPPALKMRFLYQGVSLLRLGKRIPHAFVEKMIEAPDHDTNGTLVSGAGLVFSRQDSFVFLDPDIVQNLKRGYLVYIASCGVYDLPFGTLHVSGDAESVFLDGQTGPFPLPIIVRSRMGGDTVQTATGGKKTVKKLMNDWSVRECDRDLVPVIECGGAIRAVYGTPLGYPRWYVHQQESNG